MIGYLKNENDLKKLKKQLNEKRTCFWCGNKYKMTESVGQWDCSYHPKKYNEETRVYYCCDRLVGSSGCVRCDHNEDRDFNDSLKILLPTVLYGKQKIMKDIQIDKIASFKYDEQQKNDDINRYMLIKIAEK